MIQACRPGGPIGPLASPLRESTWWGAEAESPQVHEVLLDLGPRRAGRTARVAFRGAEASSWPTV
jgi:hypothetical protein